MTRPRKILYVTGTRADYGLMASTLRQIDAHPALDLQVAVTGMHLVPDFGMTVREVEEDGLPIVARIPTQVARRSGEHMAIGLGEAVIGLTGAIQEARPDVVLLIGDRGEMLAGAIAAMHLGIPVVHLHGGERSGTVDESIRHAITKLSHWHLVATEESRERVIRMGERPEHVWVVGAPSLDGLAEQGNEPRAKVLRALEIDEAKAFVMVLFHPVLQEQLDAGAQTRSLAEAIQRALPLGRDMAVVWLEPNADAGSAEILRVLDDLPVRRVKHLPRRLYVSALRCAEFLIGNSSSGIIEAATFGTPVVNVGHRQRARQRNRNIFDCEGDAASICKAIQQALKKGRFPPHNFYGDGLSGERIVGLLAHHPFAEDLLDKVNRY
ncbi:UDP-N-acetylglucosamine 2-epimerase [Variovorax robiniae]|uniref:UDP-N-acetylglucosamine 2-epimerase n=1 Tax=Variovorax robiniae TaxID=1836199 RepID=A0ABU8XEV5_9BURK